MNARAPVKPQGNIILATPFAVLCIDPATAAQHARMRSGQLRELLRTIRPKKESDTLLWLAQQLADELAGTLSELAERAP